MKEWSGGTDLWDRRRAVIHSWYAILLSCAVFGFGGFQFMLIRTDLWSAAPYEAAGLSATMAVPPVVTALLAFRIGLRRLGRVFAARPDSEHEQVMIRILLVSLNLAYVLVLILAGGPPETFIGSVLILPPGFAGTWLLLVLLIAAVYGAVDELTQPFAGRSTDQQLAVAIRQGVGHDGRGLFVMPSAMYARLSDAEVAALIAHIRKLPRSGGATEGAQVGNSRCHRDAVDHDRAGGAAGLVDRGGISRGRDAGRAPHPAADRAEPRDGARVPRRGGERADAAPDRTRDAASSEK